MRHYDTSCGPMYCVPTRKDGVPELVIKPRPVGWGGSGGGLSEPPRFDPRSGGPRLIIVVRSLVYALRVHVRKTPGAMRIAIYVMCGLCPCYSTCAWLRCTYTLTCVARCNPNTAPE